MPVNPNSLLVNLLVTLLVIVMIFVMPALDRLICRKAGIHLDGQLSDNEHSDSLLRLRQILLVFVFLIYIGALLYLTLFSRTAANEYTIHVALYNDLAGSFRIDLGLFELIRVLFTEGISSALSHIEIIRTANLTQVYMNIALMIPMGYLLPYIFRWFRERARLRPVLAIFLISFVLENIQLITRRGFYDADDLVSNTIGGFLGAHMYITVAYVLTHPEWRKELKQFRRWRRNARKSVLFPFIRKISVSRTTLYATDETVVWDFYVKTLGFRVRRQLVPEDSKTTSFLLEAARTQIEIICLNEERQLPEQHLTFSCRNIRKVRKRLMKHGIDDGIYEPDIYTNIRTLIFSGPDHVRITILEDYDA